MCVRTRSGSTAFSSSNTSLTSPPDVRQEAVAEARGRRTSTSPAPRGTRPRSRAPRRRARPRAARTTHVTCELGLRARTSARIVAAAADLDVVGVTADRENAADAVATLPASVNAEHQPTVRGAATICHGARPLSSERVELLLVLDRVHRLPEPVVAVRDAARPRSISRANGSSTSSSPGSMSSRIVAAEDEEAAVDPDVGLRRVGSIDRTTPSASASTTWYSRRGLHRDEEAGLPARSSVSIMSSSGASVSPSPYVARNSLVVADVRLDREEPLADRRRGRPCRRT